MHAAFTIHPLVFVVLPSAVVLGMHATSRAPVSEPRERAATVFSGVLVTLLFALWLARFAGAFGGPAPL